MRGLGALHIDPSLWDATIPAYGRPTGRLVLFPGARSAATAVGVLLN